MHSGNNINNLAKLDDGLDESTTVMVVETKSKKLGKNRGIIKHSWAFVETNTKKTLLVHFWDILSNWCHSLSYLPNFLQHI